MKYRHREANINDLPSIVEIYNTSIPSRESTCDLVPITVDSRMEWFKEHQSKIRPLWVAFKADDASQKILGYLAFDYFQNTRPGYYCTADMAIYIHEDARGKGLGRYLLSEAIQFAPKIGIQTLVTTIFASNEPSLRLFKSMGFEQWGYMPKVADLEGIERDLVIIGRRIVNHVKEAV